MLQTSSLGDSVMRDREMTSALPTAGVNENAIGAMSKGLNVLAICDYFVL